MRPGLGPTPGSHPKFGNHGMTPARTIIGCNTALRLPEFFAGEGPGRDARSCASLPTAAVPNRLPLPHQRATVPAMSSVRMECRLRIERHIRENAQDLPRAE